MSFIVLFKANSWSSSVNEIEGVVTDSKGKVVHSIFGKWHESIFQGDPPTAMCIWRASEGFFFSQADFTQQVGTFINCVCVSDPMPSDQEQYYGFTQFAMELNELEPSLRLRLPPTDTRFRPDQRFGVLIHSSTT